MSARTFLAATITGVALALTLTSPAQAEPLPGPPQPIVLDFEAQQGGYLTNGWSPDGHPDVTFADTIDGGITLYTGSETNGTGLLTNGDDESALEIRLAKPTGSISMVFGNDDSCCMTEGGYALLTIFRGANEVGQRQVQVNWNNDPDQRISYAGKLFDRAVFQYVDTDLQPSTLSEAVDDIRIGAMCTIVGDGTTNVLAGTAGDDVICGTGLSEQIDGRGGHDLIYGANGADVIRGGNGYDRLAGGNGFDTLSGGAGNDVLLGKRDRDTCNGGVGTDEAITCEVVTNVP